MTDKQKVKHTIEVLNVIRDRLFKCEKMTTVKSAVVNIEDLIKLLEKKHVTDTERERKAASVEAVQLSHKLHRLILQRKRNMRQPDINKWAVDMDKILRLDERTPEQLANVIDWCQQDDFWQNNILSPTKLRKQLDRLEMQMERDHKWKRTRSVTQPRSGKTAKEKYLQAIKSRNYTTQREFGGEG